MMHIVQVANFYSPTSGGLRTAVDALRAGYEAAGHQVTLVVPGAADTEKGGTVSIASPAVSGGYRVITRVGRFVDVLAGLRPDAIEVSDKLLVGPAARVARRRGVRLVLVSHERLDGILARRFPSRRLLVAAADRWNRHLADRADDIVCASAYSGEEFARIGVDVRTVPLGVDLDTFRPAGPKVPALVVCAGRLSAEKRPEIVVDATRILCEQGRAIRVVLAGTGPLLAPLRHRAVRLPVHFLGHVERRTDMAALLAEAAVVAAPCPVETFGLAALEAMACGTPVVTTDRGAAQELLAPGAGLAVAP
ncbi:MAG: glycosyltransferase, partial [Acidimicrobiia bacterium]|nr:glycosyltransferase [Acidimicrobiia bacterium]